MTLAAIPSPSTAVWQLGPIPIRAYALCIVLGIAVACVVTEARLRRRGAAPGAVLDIAVWAVPFGIVGARIYHVISSPQDYFGDNGEPIKALFIWEGGLGIWGAVAGGAIGAWLAGRQLGIPLTVVADALAPGLPLAQAVGRFGNWFNNELFGGATTLPWGLRVHDMDPQNPGHARTLDGQPVLLPDLYHPAFLYEALWNVGVALLVLAADRRFKFGRGRAFALYGMGYTVGRFWIEMIRTDEANEFFGVRLNVWTSVLVFLGAAIYFVRVRGPRQFLVPILADDAPAGAGPAGAGATGAGAADATASGASVTGAGAGAAGDVGQRDLSAAPPGRPATPVGYRVVDEQRFLAYQRTGELPAESAAAPAGEPPDAAGAAPADAQPASSGPVDDDRPVDGEVAGGASASSGAAARSTDER